MRVRHRLGSLNDVQAAIDAYFNSCAGQQIIGSDGELLLDKNGRPVIIGEKPPTVTGLAVALGFVSRQEMLAFRGRRDIQRAIIRAKSRCEEYLESRLFDKEGMKGAEFILRCHFNWNDKDFHESDDADSFVDPLSASLRQLAFNIDSGEV